MPNTIKNNPDFTEDEVLDEGDEEAKEILPEEGLEEGGEPSDAPAEEDTPSADEEAERERLEREREALDRDQAKIDSDLERIRQENESKRQRLYQARKDRRKVRDAARDVGGVDNEAGDDDLADVDPRDIERLEKILKARGYARKEDVERVTYQEAQQSIEDEFFRTHKQYNPENDPDDVLYNALREELSLYARPQNARQIRTIMNKAHASVRGRFPDKFPKPSRKSVDAAKRQKQNLARTGSSPSGASRASTKQSSLTSEQKDALLRGGFSQEEIAEM